MDIDPPIVLRIGDRTFEIASVEQAHQVLTEDWPDERGPRHRDAVETCLKVMDGHRSVVDAQTALAAAAKEAVLLA